MKGQPFKRLNTFFAGIAALMQANPALKYQDAFSQMEYIPRKGKGFHTSNKKVNFNTMKVKRASKKNKNISARASKRG